MNTEHDKKIEDLESRISFQEDFLSEMNKRIAEQDNEIAKLQLQLQHLNQKLKETGSPTGPNSSLIDERPPHY